MASRIFSIRLDNTVVAALEALQLPSDDSLNTTLKRFVINGLGITVNTSVDTVNNDERLQELVDFKTAYLTDVMNEVKHSLESRTEALESEIEALKLRLDSLASDAPITAKSVAMPSAGGAIATKATDDKPACPICGTNDYVISHGAGRWMCKNVQSHPNHKSKTFS